MNARRRSRAAAVLDEAPSTGCPHCGRTTKTVQGVCADCWGVKDPDEVIDLRPPPRTEPLFGFGSDLEDLFWIYPIGVVGLVIGIVLVVLAVVLGVR